MRYLGLKGLVRTTIADRHVERASDLLDRDFTAPAANIRWVADFTYVRTWAGFTYVSFVADRAAHGIVATRPLKSSCRRQFGASS